MLPTGLFQESRIASRSGALCPSCSPWDLKATQRVARESEPAALPSSCCSGPVSCGPSTTSCSASPFLGKRGRRTPGFVNAKCQVVGLAVPVRDILSLAAPRRFSSPSLRQDLGALATLSAQHGQFVQGQRTTLSCFQASRPSAGRTTEARRKEEDSETVFHPSTTPFKLNRLESTLPLSATASSFKVSVRVLYSLAMHGGLIAFGSLICHLAGSNILNTMQPEPWDLVAGAALSLPPILVASILFMDPVAESWEVARGIRDAEDEELAEFYVGMSPLQYTLVSVASAVSQEVFFRAALQGGLALALYLGGAAGLEGALQGLGAQAVGMAAVSGYFPAFAPFSQLHAAVVMAAMTGSFDYATSMKSVPNVIVTDGRNLRALKATFGEWYQRQQLKSIYAPMFTAMLAFYFGLEWIFVGNLVAPMVSHSIFLVWSMNVGFKRVAKQH